MTPETYEEMADQFGARMEELEAMVHGFISRFEKLQPGVSEVCRLGEELVVSWSEYTDDWYGD